MPLFTFGGRIDGFKTWCHECRPKETMAYLVSKWESDAYCFGCGVQVAEGHA